MVWHAFGSYKKGLAWGANVKRDVCLTSRVENTVLVVLSFRSCIDVRGVVSRFKHFPALFSYRVSWESPPSYIFSTLPSPLFKFMLPLSFHSLLRGRSKGEGRGARKSKQNSISHGAQRNEKGNYILTDRIRVVSILYDFVFCCENLQAKTKSQCVPAWAMSRVVGKPPFLMGVCFKKEEMGALANLTAQASKANDFFATFHHLASKARRDCLGSTLSREGFFKR